MTSSRGDHPGQVMTASKPARMVMTERSTAGGLRRWRTGGSDDNASSVDSQYPAADVVVVVEATVSGDPRAVDGSADRAVARRQTCLGVAETVGDTVAVPVERRSKPAEVGWNVAVGAGLLAGAGVGAAGRLAARIVRPVASVVLHPPLVPEEWHPARGVEALARLGGQERASARRDLDRMVTALVPVVAEEVVARLDLDAIIARIDLAGLAEEVIESIDLPEIIRESTGTVASEVVRGFGCRASTPTKPWRGSWTDCFSGGVVEPPTRPANRSPSAKWTAST